MRAKIEKLVYGGEGLAHEGGETLFVPFVLPGEDVEIDATERKKKLVRGRVTRVWNASPDRVEPRCPHFGVCGGCDYQHVAYEAQLQAKEQILRETLRRLGRIDWSEPITVHRSPPWEYRNRAQWTVRPATDQKLSSHQGHSSTIGYFRTRSSVLCPVETCSILSPRLLETFRALRSFLAEGQLPPVLREIEAFVDARDHELLLNITCASIPHPPESLLRTLGEAAPAATSILLRDVAGSKMILHGPGFFQYEVLDKRFRVGNMSFFQVNRFLIGELASVVCKLAGTGETAFDLFAGVGLFSAWLAEGFSRVVAAEVDPASARDLETLAAASGKTIAVRNQLSAQFLREWARKRSADKPEVVVVDPPRAGLEGVVVDQLTALKSQRIVYVSCDPSTLARDLAKLAAQAYTLRDIHLFDMFPQTYHIESVVLLERTR